MAKKLKKMDVTLYFHTNVTVTVWAEDDKSAIESARGMLEEPYYKEQIMNGLQEDSAPDVEPAQQYSNEYL